MLLLGFLCLCQLIFLPGYLCIRAFRLPTNGALQTVIYSFALSLMANYQIVFLLHYAGLFTPIAIYIILGLEWTGLLLGMAPERFSPLFHLPSEGTLKHIRAVLGRKPRTAVITFSAALAGVFVFAWFSLTNFGSVFITGDAVVSWDRWAMEWAQNDGRWIGFGYYPQLLPANWSLTYVILQNTDVKMFAKAIMPLFSLATLLLFWDRFLRTGRLFWLWGVPAYALLLQFIFDTRFISAGYMEIPSAFFGFLAFCSLLEGGEEAKGKAATRSVFPLLFASGAFLAKQGGVFILAVTVCWLIARLVRRKREFSLKLAALALLLIVGANWWYVTALWRVSQGRTTSNITYLTQTIHPDKDYTDRWERANKRLAERRGFEAEALVRLFVVMLPFAVLHPQGRLALLAFFVPFYLLWAFLFSYEDRTLAIALPFAACAWACGLQSIASCIGSIPRHFAKPAVAGILRAAAWCALLVTALSFALLPLQFTIGQTLDRLTKNPWLQQLWPVWAWSLLASACLVLLLRLTSLSRPVRIPVPVLPILAACAGVLAVAQATVLPSDTLIHHQIEQRKAIGEIHLNKVLYPYFEEPAARGPIATNYFHMGFLPELGQYCRNTFFDPPVAPDLLEKVASDPDIRYIFTRFSSMTPEALEWIEHSGCEIVLEKDDWRLIQLPGRNHPSPPQD